MNASPDRTALMQQEEADMRERLARAARDIMVPGDEPRTIYKVAEIRRVSVAALNAELSRLGWVPPKRIRRCRSRAKQLSQPRSDNQT